MTHKQRPLLLYAVFASLMLHGVVVGGGTLGLPDFYSAEDEILSSKPAHSVPPVSIALVAATVAPAQAFKKATANLAPQATKTSPQPSPPQTIATRDVAPENKALIDDTVAVEDVASENAPVAEPDEAKPDLVFEPAPPFPVQLQAVFRARYHGVSVDIRQTWLMEGYNYFILNEGSKFGFQAKISSEGSVSAEGLKPEFYRALINNKLKNAAQFNHETRTLTYASSREPKQIALESLAQDMASLPYHVALSFRGDSIKGLQVTTGNSVYRIDLHLVAEELLKLPAGQIHTLHLRGTREHRNGNTQEGYDVWLAPDYRNFPVKFRGPDGKGRTLELSLKNLEYEGQPVLGRGSNKALLISDSETTALDAEQIHHLALPIESEPNSNTTVLENH